MADDVVDRIGLGVDLLGGPELLANLRLIRSEMEAIVSLAGRGPGGPPSSGAIGPRLRDQQAREKELAQARLDLERRTSNDEITIRANALNKKQNLTQQIAQRAAQLRQQEVEAERKILAQQAEDHRRFLEQKRLRVQAYSRQDDIINKDLGPERRAFRRYRNDPARDPQTDAYRRQIAEEIQGQRVALREKAEADRKLQFASDRALAINDLTQGDRFRRQSDIDSLSQRRDVTRGAQFRKQVDIDSQNRRVALREEVEHRRQDAAERAEEAELNALAERERLPRRLARGRAGSLTTFDPARPLRRPIPSSSDLEIAELRKYVQSGGDLKKFKFSGGGIGGPPDEGEGDEEGGGGKGGKAKSSGLGTIGRITRNFLLYRALTTLTFGVAHYTEASLAAAKATSEQGNALKFATEAAEGNLQANRNLADQLGQYGYNRAQAQQVVAASARATFRHPELTGALAEEVTNIAALRGGGLEETPRVLEDIIGGRDRPYREYFNTTPEEIYKEAAKKRLSLNSSTFGLKTVGKQDYETETQYVSRYVTALTEQEKEQLRLNYVLSQAYRFQGDAAERAGTLAGKMDLVSAAFFNASANVGAFIADIKPVKAALDVIAGNTPQSIFRPPELTQSGPRNTITDTDIINFGTASTIGARPRTLNTISKFTGPPRFGLPGIILSAIRGDLFNTGDRDRTDREELEYNKNIAENIAKDKQVRQRNVLRQQGQLLYRNITPNQGLPNEYSTYEQLTSRGISDLEIFKNYVEEIKPILADGAKVFAEYAAKRRELQDTINRDAGRGGNKNAQDQLSLLEAKQIATIYEGFKPSDYDIESQKREDIRKGKELQDRQEYVNQVSNALSKLRDAQQGAFRLPSDIGTALVGEENPYVKVLSDQVTIAERMRQQWGFLGQGAVDYFTKLEEGASKRSLLKLEYQTYEQATNLRGQSARETAERFGPGISRRDQDQIAIQQALLQRASERPLIDKQLRDFFKETSRPIDDLSQRVHGIYSTYLRGQSTVQGAEAKGQLQDAFSESVLGIIDELSPGVRRRADVEGIYFSAQSIKAQSLDRRIYEAQQKAEFGNTEDARLQAQLRQDANFRRKQIDAGYNPKDVGRSSDALLLSRTEGVSPKDLSFDQFRARQEALRRQADRAEQDQADAKAAVNEGLKYQASMLLELEAIRSALVGGNFSMLVQVQNDAQARIDQTSLREIAGGKHNIPALDQGEVKTNPYSGLNNRYGRGGRKR